MAMPINCTFFLDNKSISTLNCPGVGNISAFSGMPGFRGNPAAVDQVDLGPLPPGEYYIIDRQSGGRLGWLYDFGRRFTDYNRDDWFSLYRNDGKIDDETFINGVRRGNFRLHPAGPQGISKGCVTIVNLSDFNRLNIYMRAHGASIPIPGTDMKAYGTITVH